MEEKRVDELSTEFFYEVEELGGECIPGQIARVDAEQAAGKISAEGAARLLRYLAAEAKYFASK